MTNEVNYVPVRYGCNGANVDFSFPWKIFENEDIIVQIQNKEGNISTLAYGVDYTVEFEAMGGNVKLKNVYSKDNIIIISRDVSDYQSKSFSTSPGFQASEIEKSLDRVSCNLQEMGYNIENFKETFSAEIDSQIETLENVIEENKQEVLVIQERFEDLTNAKIEEFKAETNTAIKEFEDGIDAKIETVADAADKINTLDESIQLCKDSAEIATNKAEEAKELLDNTLTTSNITNCITSIPQRIKLDLSNGALTLKAGSIVIIPNGFEDDGTTRKFNQTTLSKDCTGTVGTSTAYLFSVAPSLYLGGANPSVCYSSDTVPDSPANGNFWYDTKNNIVKRYLDNAWSEGWSLPICEITDGAITNVFNGIGYVGSTVFIDKDVTALSANGRNENGTLNNESYTTNSVKLIDLRNWEATGYDTEGFILRAVSPSMGRDLWAFQPNQRFFDNIDSAPPGSSYYAYVESENQWYTSDATSWHKANVYIYAAKKLKGGYFKPKTTFRAVDYSDKSIVSSWALPSDKFTDLTLGASGSKYTAPANGWVVLRKKATAVGQYVQLTNNTASSLQFYIPSGTSYSMMCGYLPVKTGDTFTATYTADSTDYSIFRFIYAQGEDY